MIKGIKQIKSNLGCVYRGTQDTLRNWASRTDARYAYYYEHCKIRENVVLYESYFGKGLVCNPYAIFLHLLKDSNFSHLQHIWTVNDDELRADLEKEYKDKPNVRFVKRHSRQYLKYLCSAKYLVNNVTFHTYFVKKEGQIYINTWHGIPLKTLGYDTPNGKIEASNVVRNFLQTDYMISASPFLTEIYKKVHKLENIYQGKIIEEGYPRLDLLVSLSREEAFRKLHMCGVEADIHKKVILFAPTWRGKSYAEASTDVDFYFEFRDYMQAHIDTNKYQILVKVHQRVYELAKDKLTDSFFIPSSIDANEVLGITDILVSDFSSIYIDFLATGKPLLFYITDLDSYQADRGLYRSPDCLPGPCADNLPKIAEWINHIDLVQAQYLEKYEAERQWSNGYDAGAISKKIVDIVFSLKEGGYLVHKPHLPKKRLLISRGKMLVNGISTSLLNFLDNLDYSEWDVSLMVAATKQEKEKKLIQQINPNVRVLCRNSANCLTWWDHVVKHYYNRNGCKNIFHPMYARDVRRSYGPTKFDYILDFEGYNTYYATLCLQQKDAYKCIWQHSDMMAEKNARFAWLEKIFALYQHYDKVVSCSYDVMLENRKNLAGIYCDAEKFSYVKNFIGIRRFEELHNKAEFRTYEGRNYLLLSEGFRNGYLNTKMLCHIPGTAPDGRRNYRFVTIGRASVEKNHKSLIQAFAKLRGEFDNVYLYILGDGPLKKDTDELISSLELTECVFAPGNVENPFSVLENCDCFILPSLHEGQPMVIHEARMAQMPIIVSNFSSVNGVLLENGQLVTGTEPDDLYNAMCAFIQGQVPANYTFDPNEYNRQAYQELMNVFGLKPGAEHSQSGF